MNEQSTNKTNITVPSSNLESDSCNASDATEKITGLDSPCSIHLHSRRKRLADPDGISGKAAIDGLVHGGLLKDDSPKHVKEVSCSQIKCEKGEEEKTVILVRWGTCLTN